MGWNALIDRFAKEVPVATMVRALMANILSAKELDAIFRDRAEQQWENQLLFSTVVDLLSLVVTKAKPSLHAAYQTHREELGVSAKALYDKVAGVELPVTQELMQRTAARMREVLEALDPARPSLLPGYEVRILDGSHLAGTEHRIQETRKVRGAPLPGHALVVLDPRWRLVVDIIPCADGHAQERSLLPELVETLAPRQLWIADRNFCTVMWLHEVALNQAFFIQREHAGTPVEVRGPRQQVGRCETGMLYEQAAVVPDGFGNELPVRRIILVLDAPTEDGDTEIVLLSNLPADVSALQIAALYRERWMIEAVFGELTLSLRGEINTLSYPGAALLSYAIALVTYNLLSVVTAALRVAHTQEQEIPETSFYYLADEVTGTWRGMEIAIAAEEWDQHFALREPGQLADDLRSIASHARLSRYRKHKRGPKKPPPKRRGQSPHVSTARLLETRKR
jgi:IS4 transposase